MKWIYAIKDKLKAAFALSIVFLLILLTNCADKKHFSELATSFSSVYKDRLLAETYIYKLSGLINQKKSVYQQSTQFADYPSNKKLNDSIKTLISKYELTYLTKDENLVFTSLKKELNHLNSLENQIAHTKTENKETLLSDIEKSHLEISNKLDSLSEIQLTEGKKLIEQSSRIISGSNLSSQLEVCILIIIGVIIQALIFSSKSLVPKFQQKSNLN